MSDTCRLAIIHLLCVIASFVLHSRSTMASECPVFHPCGDLKIERVSKANSSDELDWNNVTDEITIGRQGHWEGIVPVFYQMTLNFSNHTHYTGSVNITIRLVKDTDRIMINHDASYGGIDYNSVSIKQHCTAEDIDESMTALHSNEERRQTLQTGCICSASLSEAHGTLGLKLLNAKLRKDSVYTLSIEFYGRSQSTYGTSVGLDDTDGAEAYALTTLFQMRHAREVFPCFDHPNLKAKFQLCMEYPDHLMAASNTPTRGNLTVAIDRKAECFEETPIMSTYLFTFALMENYTTESTVVPNRSLTIELFAPVSKIQKFLWILDESLRAIEYMERITKFPYPLQRLGFLVTFTGSTLNIENFGLISINSRNENPAGTLYHEVIHQWLGNLVTATDWRYVCLQEGLTQYYQWKIENGLEGNTVTADYPHKHFGPHEPFIRHFGGLMEVLVCSKVPPYFFYALDVWDGQGSLAGMVQILLKKYAFKGAGVDEWDKALDEAIASNGGELRGYLKAWMTLPGRVDLFAWHTIPPFQQDSNTICITVRQMMGNVAVSPRPVPLVLHTFSAHGVELARSKVILTKQDQLICDLAGPAFLISPNTYLPFKKFYGLKNYYHLMKGWNENFIGKYNKQWVSRFCESFMKDEFPLEEEQWDFSQEVLIDFMDAAAGVVEVETGCECCLASSESIVEKKNITCTKKLWKQMCSGLRLVKKVFKIL